MYRTWLRHCQYTFNSSFTFAGRVHFPVLLSATVLTSQWILHNFFFEVLKIILF